MAVTRGFAPRGLCLAIAAGACAGACAPERAPVAGEPAAWTGAITPPAAFCSAMVTGTGVVDVETDYLPHVVACENGGADYEALKVQAVSARTFLYYKLLLQGYINDGTGDQVYSCGNTPGPEHYAAVMDTSGQILMYSGVVIAAFYVAGALQSPPSCMGGTSDPTGTEGYVTYNWGASGSGIEQTTLGWVDPGNLYNRGCMSQNGSDCLAGDGWVYTDILHFYYGDDIALVTAAGPCTSGMAPACTPAAAVTCGGSEALSNDAAGSTDVVTFYPCVTWSYPGPEIAWSFTAAASEPVTISVTGLLDDLDLFVLDGAACDPYACLAASDNSMTTDETVTFDAVEGNDYVIVVDGWEGTSGTGNTSPFSISFACTAPPPPPPPGSDSGTAPPPPESDSGSGGGPGASDAGDGDGGGLNGACACRAAGRDAPPPAAALAALFLAAAALIWRRRR